MINVHTVYRPDVEILIMIEMLTQNSDAAKHQLVQSMPLSMVVPRSTKPNKHFPFFLG